jgi:hypothetical protein
MDAESEERNFKPPKAPMRLTPKLVLETRLACLDTAATCAIVRLHSGHYLACRSHTEN